MRKLPTKNGGTAVMDVDITETPNVCSAYVLENGTAVFHVYDTSNLHIRDIYVIHKVGQDIAEDARAFPSCLVTPDPHYPGITGLETHVLRCLSKVYTEILRK